MLAPQPYLVIMTTRVPGGTSAEAVDDIRAREDAHSRELASQGHLLRLWRPPLQPGEWRSLPGEERSLGLWRAQDAAEMQAILKSLPLDAWMTVQTRPLTPHPSDPATAKT
jgi:muconolactone delta-isomerase